MKTAADWIALTSLVLGSAGFFSGIYFWWSGSIKKTYAAERDFLHLKRNQEMITQGITDLEDEMRNYTDRISERFSTKLDRTHDELGEIKALLLAHLGIDMSNKKKE